MEKGAKARRQSRRKTPADRYNRLEGVEDTRTYETYSHYHAGSRQKTPDTWVLSSMGLPSEIARSKNMFYTYVLKSKKDAKFYYGYTTDLAQRFEQHSKGQVDSIKDRRPLKLIYYEACCTKEDALKREKYFKTYRGRQFLQNRLKSYFTQMT